MNAAEATTKGELLKQRGMRLASTGREKQTWELQLAFLEAIRRAPDQTATLDAAVADLGEGFAKGGRWRGPAVRQLSDLGLIERAGFALSIRPARHRGPLSTWRAADLGLIAAKIAELRRLLAASEKPAIEQPELFQ